MVRGGALDRWRSLTRHLEDIVGDVVGGAGTAHRKLANPVAILMTMRVAP